MKKYNCTYIGGGGIVYDDGIWERHDTPKTITVTKIAEKDGYAGVYAMHNVGEKIRIGRGTIHPLQDDDSGDSFVVYFRQAGIPYYFEAI